MKDAIHKYGKVTAAGKMPVVSAVSSVTVISLKAMTSATVISCSTTCSTTSSATATSDCFTHSRQECVWR